MLHNLLLFQDMKEAIKVGLSGPCGIAPNLGDPGLSTSYPSDWEMVEVKTFALRLFIVRSVLLESQR